MSTSQPPLRFTSHKSLASRLTLSTLLGRAIHISQIRPSSPTSPGLAPHEISLLRLLESITNGSHIEISYTGTILLYKPGLITGTSPGSGASSSGVLTHTLPATYTRGLSYLLIPLLLLAPFSKSPISILFTGPGVITSSTPQGDISVDTLRTAILPLYTRFGLNPDNLNLRILQRAHPNTNTSLGSGGEVHLTISSQVRLPTTLHLLSSGRIKTIRGVASTVGVPPANNARLITSARAILNRLAPSVYIFSDTSSAPLIAAPTRDNPKLKKKTGLGYALSLVAESTSGCLYSADAASAPAGAERDADDTTPEDVGKRAAYALLESIARGGCVAVEGASTVLTLMAMGSTDVGRVVLGRNVVGSEEVIRLARDLSEFGCAGWGLREAGAEKDEGAIVVSVVGTGVGNVGRKVG